MPKSKSYAETVTGLEWLLAALEANSGDLPQLDLPRQRLQALLDQIRSFAVEQGALTASRQQATEQIYALLAQSRKLGTVLRTAVREHYGNRSQKVVEFGLQPLRTRPRRADEPSPTPE
jgi:hypothetical protein